MRRIIGINRGLTSFFAAAQQILRVSTLLPHKPSAAGDRFNATKSAPCPALSESNRPRPREPGRVAGKPVSSRMPWAAVATVTRTAEAITGLIPVTMTGFTIKAPSAWHSAASNASATPRGHRPDPPPRHGFHPCGGPADRRTERQQVIDCHRAPRWWVEDGQRCRGCATSVSKGKRSISASSRARAHPPASTRARPLSALAACALPTAPARL